MSYLTKYGTLWGTIPATTGRLFWVAPSASYTIEGRSFIASDDGGHDGLSPERALLTIQRGIDLCTASVGDVVVLLEGTHTPSATINVNKAGIKILGVGHSAQGISNFFKPKVIVRGATGGNTGLNDDLFNVTVGGVEIGYVELVPTMGYDAVCFETAAALDGFHMHHFRLDMSTASVSTKTRGINFSHRRIRAGSDYGIFSGTGSAISNVFLHDFAIEADGAQGPGLEIATAFVVARAGYIYNTAGTWAAPVRIATAADNSLLDGLRFMTSGTMGQCIEGTDATIQDGVAVTDCRFPANLTARNKPLDGFTVGANNSGEVILGENYIMTATGGVAAVLIT